MARRSRKKNGKKSLVTVMVVAGTAFAAVGITLFMQFLHSNRGADRVNTDFRVESYRKEGSRFASAGNVYRLEGTVENIETVGNSRLLSVSLPGQEMERLPLLVPGDASISINIERSNTYIFSVSCRTGQDAEGKQVKGILIVNDVKYKS